MITLQLSNTMGKITFRSVSNIYQYKISDSIQLHIDNKKFDLSDMRLFSKFIKEFDEYNIEKLEQMI